MPGSKTYEMKIQLNATTGGSFNRTFSRAQQELSRMQQEIQRLNFTQGDISAYQKQQSAIERTKAKVALYREQLENLQKAQGDVSESSEKLTKEEAELANAIAAKKQQLSEAEAKEASQTEKLKQMGDALREAGVNTDNLTTESQRLESEMNDLRQSQEQVAASAEEMGDGMVSAMDAAAAALAAAGIAAGLKEIYEAFKECVTIAAGFEATMSTVEALSGANAQEMAALTAQAKELGATTAFTAQQSGEAMTYMAMAGWDATEMLSGMDGVLQLAAASGEDLAMVSDIVTDNLTAFGLKASDTARFADVLAAAATNSNTSVAIMGETFKNSASLAGALGYSVEDVAVAIGLMANAGIKGSNAGTALKNMFSNLIDTVTLTSSAFGEVEYSAINADGTMKSWGQTMQDLRGYFAQMTGAEKMQNAETLVGTRAMTGFVDIMNASEDDFVSLTATINDCAGAAGKMAEIKLDNLAGDITLAQSAAEALKVSIGDALTPALRTLISTGTDALEWLNDFTAANPEAVRGIAGITTGVLAAASALTAFSAAAKVVRALNLAQMFTSPLGAITLATGALAGLAVVSAANRKEAKKNRDDINNLLPIYQRQQREIQALNQEYEMSVERKGRDSSKTLALKNQIDDLTAAYEENRQTLYDWSQATDKALSTVRESRESYENAVSGIEEEETSVLALNQRLQELAGKTSLTSAEQEQMRSIVTSMNQALPELGLNYDATTGKLNKSSEAIINATKALGKKRYEEQKMERSVELYAQEEDLSLKLADAKEELRLAEEQLAVAKEAARMGGDKEYYQDQQEVVRELTSGLADLEAEYSSVTAELSGYESTLADAANETLTMESAIADLDTALGNLQTAYNKAYAAARESLEGQFGLWDKAEQVTSISFDTIIENLQSQKEYWDNYEQNFNAVQQAAQKAGIDISGILLRLSDSSQKAVAVIAGLADEIRNSSDNGKSALQELANVWGEKESSIDRVSDTIASGAESVQTAMGEVRAAIEAGAGDLNMSVKFSRAASDTIQGYVQGLGDGSQVGTILSQQAKSWLDQFNAALGTHSPSTITDQSGKDTIQGFVQGAEATTPAGVTAMNAAAQAFISAFQSQMNTDTLYSAGRNALQGAINGINSMIPALVAAARNAGIQTSTAYQNAQKIQSPSKVFKYFGEMDIVGVIKGIQGKQAEANKAFAAAATSNVEAYRDAMSAQQATGEVVTRLNAEGVSAMAQPEWTEAVVIPPQFIEAIAAYKQATTRTEAEQIQADRMDRLIAAIRSAPGGDDRPAPSPIQINIVVQGNPSPETVERLEDFVYSDAFEERVREVTERDRQDAVRRRY